MPGTTPTPAPQPNPTRQAIASTSAVSEDLGKRCSGLSLLELRRLAQHAAQALADSEAERHGMTAQLAQAASDISEREAQVAELRSALQVKDSEFGRRLTEISAEQARGVQHLMQQVRGRGAASLGLCTQV
jgi:hypothetical protein